ncbi:uncharacterized protein EV420DRAFT_1754600 [Desarmillaria tabescens]|uniref:DUF6534 domain-containing protein n=1 Tax=Armillaria tabescens TaxID=1929756 RepID=A0AA39J110_ARMTA|nr:uncharacterized protein EV420DRAFT_1754600 [Desarmillaria tabescens]KAK0434155.1 hypothetical protein EV420DRAFT_1754600 [Desarmillaria tabescens]
MQPVPAGYPIERLSGPLIVAYLLHWGLFGTLSVQLYLYYLAFPKDRQFTKYLVYGIYIVEFVQTMLVTHDAFAMFGYGFGDIEALTDMHFDWLTVPIMSAAVACVGQVFYAYRIFVLSKSQIVPIFVTCVSLTSSVAAIITGVYSFEAGNVTKLNNRKTSIAVGIWCGASALCDIVIAICMTYYLMRSDTGFRRTRMLVTKLIRLTIETGTVTAVVALLNLILFFAFPHQTFYGTPALIMPKLYANTVYMVLNSRIRILGGRDTYTSSMDMSITTTMIRDTNSQSTQGTRRMDGRQGAPVVAITKEVFNDDYEMRRMNDKSQDKSVGYPDHNC